MPQYTEPNLGLVLQWDFDYSGWNTEMDNDLRKLGSVVFLSVISMAVADPPATPTDGDRYIVASPATGAWAGQEGNLAVYLANDASAGWFFYPPAAGWVLYDQNTDAVLFYDGTYWLPVQGSKVGQAVHDMTTDADYTLTKDQYYQGIVEITDTGTVLTAGRSIIMPTESGRQWTVKNSTAQILTFTTAAGAGVAVGAGLSAIVRGDGTDIVRVTADT